MKTEEYLEGVIRQLEYYKSLSERTFDQLETDMLFKKPSQESNSIGIIVKHLVGNMISRFTDFLESDGEKDWRERDAEFEGEYKNRKDLLDAWNKAWEIVFEAITTVENIDQLVYIRNQGHTVYEAINRQLAHYAYHIGQIVYLGKLFKNEDWISLSIPKNKSKQFNKEKFDLPKKRGHFTDDFLDKK